MARLEIDGIDAFIQDMKREAATVDKRATKVLRAGADVVKKAWKDEIQRRGFVKTGSMEKNVKIKVGGSNNKGPAYALVYTNEKDKRGVRNGLKAAVLNYGTKPRAYKSSRRDKKFPGPGIPATRWVDTAERTAEAQTLAAMKTAWEKER